MDDVRVGQWNSKSDIATGMSGGLPLTVFDKAMENTIVISPFKEFMATSSHLDTSSNPRVLKLGVFGKADKVNKAQFISVICTLTNWTIIITVYMASCF